MLVLTYTGMEYNMECVYVLITLLHRYIYELYYPCDVSHVYKYFQKDTIDKIRIVMLCSRLSNCFSWLHEYRYEHGYYGDYDSNDAVNK